MRLGRVFKLWPLGAAGVIGVTLIGTTVLPGFMHIPVTPVASAVRRVTNNAPVAGRRLEDQFKTEQNRLSDAKNALDKAGTPTDTTAKNALTEAQGHYDRAKSIIGAHAGFDANGKVTDAGQARTTVQTAGRELGQFQNAMRNEHDRSRFATPFWGRNGRPLIGTPEEHGIRPTA